MKPYFPCTPKANIHVIAIRVLARDPEASYVQVGFSVLVAIHKLAQGLEEYPFTLLLWLNVVVSTHQK